MRPIGRAVLYLPDGSRRPDAEVLQEVGNVGLRLALLDDAMQARATSCEAESCYPPRLFLSYKWGSDADDAWVEDLARKLAVRGWDVVFDGARDESLDRTVEEFVSRLATCSVFVAVLSPFYVASAVVARRPTWVFDEWQCALVAKDRLRLVGLIPPGAGEESRRVGLAELYDVRDDDALERCLDDELTFRGPKLDPAEHAWVADRLELAVQGPRDPASAGPLQEIVERFPFVLGAWRRLVVLRRDTGDLVGAAQAVVGGLQHVVEPRERLMFLREHIELLKRGGERVAAAATAVGLIDQLPHDWVAHFHLGDLLDDVDDPWPARNHLWLAIREGGSRAAPHNVLAVVYMRLGLLQRATEELELALRLDPELAVAHRNLERVRAARTDAPTEGMTEIAGPLPGCSECDAIFVPRDDRPLVCGSCGATKPKTPATCHVCGNQTTTPIVGAGTSLLPVPCPFCRTGSVVIKEHAAL